MSSHNEEGPTLAVERMSIELTESNYVGSKLEKILCHQWKATAALIGYSENGIDTVLEEGLSPPHPWLWSVRVYFKGGRVERVASGATREEAMRAAVEILIGMAQNALNPPRNEGESGCEPMDEDASVTVTLPRLFSSDLPLTVVVSQGRVVEALDPFGDPQILSKQQNALALKLAASGVDETGR